MRPLRPTGRLRQLRIAPNRPGMMIRFLVDVRLMPSKYLIPPYTSTLSVSLYCDDSSSWSRPANKIISIGYFVIMFIAVHHLKCYLIDIIASRKCIYHEELATTHSQRRRYRVRAACASCVAARHRSWPARELCSVCRFRGFSSNAAERARGPQAGVDRWKRRDKPPVAVDAVFLPCHILFSLATFGTCTAAARPGLWCKERRVEASVHPHLVPHHWAQRLDDSHDLRADCCQVVLRHPQLRASGGISLDCPRGVCGLL